MPNLSSEDDVLTRWLRQQLSHERELLEKRHDALLHHFQALLKQENQLCSVLPPEDVNPDMATVEMEGKKVDNVSFKDPIGREDQPAKVDDTPRQATLKGKLMNDRGTSSKANFSVTPGEVENTTPSFVKSGWKRSYRGTSRLGRLVTGRIFELFFASVIFMNMVEMALQMQYVGLSNGFLLGYPKFSTPKEDAWPGMDTVFVITGWMFGILYTIELVLKIFVLRCAFVDSANLVDLLIVMSFYVEKLLGATNFPIDPMIFRLFRLLRVLRLLKLVHFIAGLGQLLLMVTALKGCLKMLAWATMLLFGMHVIVAFVLNQILSEVVIENDNFERKTRLKCFEYFGTFSRAVFSMFELTLANWIPLSRFLIEDIHESMVIFAAGYKLTLGFAVVGVVNACFIKETFKVVATDRAMMVIEKTAEKKAFVREMQSFMDHAELLSSGEHDRTLSEEEFVAVCHDVAVKNWLAAQGLDASDAKKLFHLMDDGSGSLEISELIAGIAKLKGPAKSLDMTITELEVRDILRRITQSDIRLQRIEDATKMPAKTYGHSQLTL